MEADYVRVFKRGQFFYKTFGVWPTNDRTWEKFSRFRSYAVGVIAVAVFFFQTSLIVELDGIESVLEFAAELMACVVTCIKVLTIATKRGDVLKMIEITRNLAISCECSLQEEETIIEYWQKLRDRLIKILINAYSVIFFMYIFFPLVKENEFPMAAVVPKILYATPWYQITYVIEVIVLFFRFVGFVSCDLFCCTFLCELLKELALLQCSMQELQGSNDRTRLTIQRHARVMEYGTILCKMLSPLFMFQHIIAAGFLCLIGITVNQMKDMLILARLLSLGITAITMLLIFCLVGETVMNYSLGVAAAIEQCAYEKCLHDVPFLKSVTFALMRAQRPLQILVCTKGVMNLSFFSETMNRVVSFFLFLKTMVE